MDAQALVVREAYARRAVLARVSRGDDLREFAHGAAPRLRRDPEDVLLKAVERRNPRRVGVFPEVLHVRTHVAAALRTRAPTGKVLVGDVEVVRTVAREFGLGRAVVPAVALHAVAVQDGLDVAREAEAVVATPRGWLKTGGGTLRGDGLPDLRGRHGDVVPVRMAADAALPLARHEMRERAHPLHRAPFRVERQKIDRHVRGRKEVRAAVRLHVRKAPHALRRVSGPATHHGELETELALARLGADVLLHLLHHRDALHLAALHVPLESDVDVLHHHLRKRSRVRLAHVRALGGGFRPRRKRLRRIPAQAIALRHEQRTHLFRVEAPQLDFARLRHEVARVIHRVRRRVRPAHAVAADAVLHRRHPHLRREVADRPLRVAAERHVDEPHRPVARTVMRGHDAEEGVGTPRHVVREHERGGGEHAIAEHAGKAGSVRLDRPQALNRNRRAIDVLPAAEEDASVAHHGRREVGEVVRGETHHVLSVAVRAVEHRRRGGPTVRERGLAVARERDAAVRQPAGVLVVAGTGDNLLQSRAVRVDAPDRERFGHRALPAEKNLLSVIRDLCVQHNAIGGVDELSHLALREVAHVQPAALGQTLHVVSVDVRGLEMVALHHDHRAARHDVRRRSRHTRPFRNIPLARVPKTNLEILHRRRRIRQCELHGHVLLPIARIRTKHRSQQGRAVALRAPLVRIVKLHARILHPGRDVELQCARARRGEVETAIDAVRTLAKVPDFKTPLRLVAIPEPVALHRRRAGHRAPAGRDSGEVHEALPRTRPHPLIKEFVKRNNLPAVRQYANGRRCKKNTSRHHHFTFAESGVSG